MRAGPSRQRSRRRAAIAALAAGVALSAAACGRGGEAEVQVAAAQRGDLLAKILCDGNLEPPRGGELRAADGGTVAELAVHEGERVRRGQLLLRLALPDLAAHSREARADLDRLESERAGAVADLARAEADLADRRRIVEGDPAACCRKGRSPAPPPTPTSLPSARPPPGRRRRARGSPA